MLPRFNRNDVGIIAHYLGSLVMLFGGAMLIPLVVSVVYAEWAISCNYILGIGIALTLGSLLRLARIDPRRMERKHAIAITGLVWIVGALVAAVPLFLSGHYDTFLDAVFEGVSGLTATGLTLVRDIDHLSMADNMWRMAMQFLGGQGVVVIALSLGIFTRTGNSLYTSEGRQESIVPNIKNTSRFIWRFAVAAVLVGTVVSTVVLLFMGMSPDRSFFHALWVTIGAYDTGGFAPSSLSLMAYHSWALEIIVMLLMMFGALNFALIAQVHKGNWREFLRDIEVRTLALWITGMVLLFVGVLAVGSFLTDFSGLMRRGIFTIVSATTNTGYQVLSTGQITTLLSSGAFFLVAVSMAIGGSSASTAGGIKALRVGLILKGIALRVRSMLQPSSAQITTHYNHIGRHQLVPELLSSAMIIAALYVITYVLGALVGVAFGYDALHATFESISAASNAGLSSGIVQPGMPVPLEVLYILMMWMGRLEFITLLALFAAVIGQVMPRRKPRPLKAGTGTDGSVKTVVAVVLAAVLAGMLLLAPARAAYGAGQEGQDTEVAALDTRETVLPVPQSEHKETRLPYALHPSTDIAVEDMGMAEEVTISELAEVPERLDNALVVLEGEVVGDIINAGPEDMWLTLSDNSKAINVYLSREHLAQISNVGGYACEGTRLRIAGDFYLSCNQHDGTSDVHVRSVLAVVDEGGETPHLPNTIFLVVGLSFIVVAVILSGVYGLLRKRRR